MYIIYWTRGDEEIISGEDLEEILSDPTADEFDRFEDFS